MVNQKQEFSDTRKIELSHLADIFKECSEGKERFCFILGAGASKESGIRTGEELAKIWLEEIESLYTEAEIKKWLEETKIDRNNPGNYYSAIYKKRFGAKRTQGYFRLQKEMEEVTPSCGYYYLTRIISEYESNLVITTNFDSLLEDSIFALTDKKPLVISHESLAEHLDVLANRPVVAKIHRDVLLQPKNEKEETDELEKAWVKVLEKALEIYTPIVIGYGGNDGSLMKFLKDIAPKTENEKNKRTMFWCYYEPGGEPLGDIQDLVKSYNGSFVPIDGFDKAMLYLSAEIFDYSLPYADAEKKAQRYNDKYHETIHKAWGIPINKLETPVTADERFKPLIRKSIDKLKEIIKVEPNNTQYYYDLGFMYHVLKEYKMAIENYQEAIKLTPESANAKNYSSLGVVYYYNKDYDNAIKYEREAIEIASKAKADDKIRAKYYRNRAMTYYRVSKYRLALNDLNKTINLDDGNAEYYFARGVTYLVMEDYKRADNDYIKAKELAPCALYFAALAWTAYKLCDLEAVEDYLNKANDKCAYAYRIRGKIALSIAKKIKAECKPIILENFDNAIAKEEKDWLKVGHYIARAEYYFYVNNLPKAYEDLMIAKKLNDRNEDIWELLSKYFKAIGDIAQKEECYQTYLDLIKDKDKNEDEEEN